MGIGEVLVYVGLIVMLTIYIHFEKRYNYQKGFQDGVEHYSNLVEKALHKTNQFNKEAEESGTDLRAYLESIKPINKENKDE